MFFKGGFRINWILKCTGSAKIRQSFLEYSTFDLKHFQLLSINAQRVHQNETWYSNGQPLLASKRAQIQPLHSRNDRVWYNKMSLCGSLMGREWTVYPEPPHSVNVSNGEHTLYCLHAVLCHSFYTALWLLNGPWAAWMPKNNHVVTTYDLTNDRLRCAEHTIVSLYDCLLCAFPCNSQ
jgi:hypothetical protein